MSVVSGCTFFCFETTCISTHDMLKSWKKCVIKFENPTYVGDPGNELHIKIDDFGQFCQFLHVARTKT